MHIDARQLPAGEQQADVCIIGAGPAGISLARQLGALPLRVALLESGGMAFDPQMQQLADGPTHGPILPAVKVNRRQFGGNANVWGIKLGGPDKGLRHALFDELDFEPRPWVPHSGWPIRREELMPYYRRAQQVCGGGPFAYEPQAWIREETQPLPLEGVGLQTGIFQFSPYDVFCENYRRELVAHERVTVYTHATAVELCCAEASDAVQCVRVARPRQGDWTLRARVFVLASGGFENPRLLLASRRRHPFGLGNAHDVVGRYYHDHLQGRSGYLWPRERSLLSRAALYDLRVSSGSYVMAYLKLSPELQARERLLNINTLLFPRARARQDEAIQAFNTLRERRLLWSRPGEVVPPLGLRQTLGQAWTAARGLDYVARMALLAKRGRQSTAYGLGHGGWSCLDHLDRRFARLELWHSIEQSPRPENRVTLSRSRDLLGSPRAALHWHWPEDDIEQTERAMAVVARQIEVAGLGRVERVHDRQGLPCIDWPGGSHHLMGTTRMHADPRQGVVDAQCRVHGVPNLYVAGSSVFPTGGYANPTLTLVALALRLADRLSLELALRPTRVLST